VTSSPLTATSGSDYKPVAARIAFAAGATQKTVSLQALADALAEDPEKFAVTIDQPTGDAQLGTPARAVVTIKDPPAGPALAPTGTDDTPSAGGTSHTTDTSGTATSTYAGQTAGTTPDPGSSGADATADRQAPVIGALRVTRKAISYTLSEPAKVTLRIQRGRRTVRTLIRSAKAGRNRAALRLPRGTYHLRIAATDAAGNHATAPPGRSGCAGERSQAGRVSHGARDCIVQ